jgi:hypothetical protein
MKKLLILPISLVFLFTVATPLIGFAQTDETQIETTTQAEDPAVAETDKKEQKESRGKRIEAAKEKQTVRLDESQKKRLAARCKPAQAKIAVAKNRVKGLSTSRSQVYKNLKNRLDGVVDKLTENSIDTTELEASITELQTKINRFNTNLDAYNLSLTDLELMDCEADTEGFKAALEQSREQIKALKAESETIHTFLKEDIKTILKALKSDSADETDEATKTEGEQ